LKKKLSIAIFDLDFFKQINDQFGHLIGDKVLREFAGRLKSGLRQQDVIGRIGGDEFCILYLESTRTDAQKISGRIREQWQDIEIPGGNPATLKATFSMGIASVRKGDHCLADCIQRADRALYRAKNKGRNRIEVG